MEGFKVGEEDGVVDPEFFEGVGEEEGVGFGMDGAAFFEVIDEDDVKVFGEVEEEDSEEEDGEDEADDVEAVEGVPGCEVEACPEENIGEAQANHDY